MKPTTAVSTSDPSGPGAGAHPDAPQHTEDPQAASTAAKIATFVPMSLRGEDREVLEAVMPTARQYVTAAKPANPDQVRRFMRPVAGLLVSRVKDGETLDPEIDLDPGTIAYYVNHTCKDASRELRHDLQWALTLVGQSIVPHLHAPKRKGIGRQRRADTYSVEEEEVFLVAAGLRCDLGWPGDAWVVVAVLGAGMNGTEARAAQPSDLFALDDGRLAVRARGKRARAVPIRNLYVDLAYTILEAATDGPFIAARGRAAVHAAASRIAVDGGPSLTLARGRVTWLKAHLVAGTRWPALRRIAGPVTMDTCTYLLREAAEEISDEEALIEGLRA